jgi:hypothetical protein
MRAQPKDLVVFLTSTAVVAALIAAFNYAIDPLQIFHPPLFYSALYSSDPRFQDAGLIHSQNFDTVFMGTSLGIHVRQSDIDEHIGGKSVKLAMSGGTSKEQNLVLSAALHRLPKRIVWQMDDYMFRSSEDVEAYLQVDLYRMNPKGIAGYLFSFKTSRESIWILLRLWKRTRAIVQELLISGYLKFDQAEVNEINTFPPGMSNSAFNAAHAKEAFRLSLRSPAEITLGIDYDSMKSNFDRDAIMLIKENPNTAFVVYFPPYSILRFVAMREVAPEALETIYKFNAYQLERLAQLSNVALYDFRDISEITHNLDNYRDTVHYWATVDNQILAFIAFGEHRVDPARPTAAIDNLKKQVERYRFEGAE